MSKKGKEPILQAYTELAYKIGVTNITLQKLAEQANCSFGRVHHHFGSDNTKIVRSAIEYVGQAGRNFITRYLQEHKDQPVPIFRYIQGTFSWAQVHPEHICMWIYFYHLATSEVELKKSFTDSIDIAQERIHSLVLEGSGMGFYPVLGSKSQQKAGEVHRLLISSIIMAAINGDYDTEQAKLLEIVQELLEFVPN